MRHILKCSPHYCVRGSGVNIYSTMSNLQDEIDYNLTYILSLIENEVEESIHLDFKSADALDKSDGKKKEISKDVSSFANSDGGIIIYGINEENHKAHSISYVNGYIYTKEWLEQIINSSIQRRISDLIIYPIRNNGRIEETVYVVKIPKSYDAPHICKDKRFYKRFNFESVQMEEFEIRQLYGQKIKSKLAIDSWTISERHDKRDIDGAVTFRIEVSIVNVGNTVESTFKVNFNITNFDSDVQISWPSIQLHYNYLRLDDNKVQVSANGISAVYPDETVNGIRFDLKVPKERIVEIFSVMKIEIRLYYSNGEALMEDSLLEYLGKII